MVTQDSATKSLPHEWIEKGIAINADHSNIVKFNGEKDPHYQDVHSMFKEMVEKAPEFLRERARSSMFNHPQDTKVDR